MVLIIRYITMEIMRKFNYVAILISIREGITLLWIGHEGPAVITRSAKSKMD